MDSIIAALLALIGPFLGKLLEALLASLFQKAAKKVSATGNETNAEIGRKILTKTIDDLPRRRFGLKTLLRAALNEIPEEGNIPKTISKTGQTIIKEAAAVAKKE